MHEPSPPAAQRYWIVRVVAFLFVFAVLQLGWQSLRGSAFERLLIHDATVRPAAMLVNLLTPDVHARAVEFSLRAAGGGLNILNGCEGLEALFLLLAAFAVAPLTLRLRAIGMLCGIAVVFVVNQARILGLFYAYRWDRSWFDPLHSMVAPIVVVLTVTAYFYACLTAAQRHADLA